MAAPPSPRPEPPASSGTDSPFQKLRPCPLSLTCEWNLSPPEGREHIKPLTVNLLSACINRAREFPVAEIRSPPPHFSAPFSPWSPDSGPRRLPGSHSVLLLQAGHLRKKGDGAGCELSPGRVYPDQKIIQIIKSLMHKETFHAGPQRPACPCDIGGQILPPLCQNYDFLNSVKSTPCYLSPIN